MAPRKGYFACSGYSMVGDALWDKAAIIFNFIGLPAFNKGQMIM